MASRAKKLGVLMGATAGAAWAGLQVYPEPFPPFSPAQDTPDFEMVDLPANLPAPVARYFRAAVGLRVPVIRSAVISGRANLRLSGITFPARFRFFHQAGQNYRHYFELTLFGNPIVRVNEYYLDGVGRMELPRNLVENDPKINSAANLGLWAESSWLPSILLTDPRVRWEAVDDSTARLVVPYQDEEQSLTTRFDPISGLPIYTEAMRYRDVSDYTPRLWITEGRNWRSFHNILIPGTAAVTWLDQGKPWIVMHAEDIEYNVDVDYAILSHEI